jgi:hypothetical protein
MGFVKFIKKAKVKDSFVNISLAFTAVDKQLKYFNAKEARENSIIRKSGLGFWLSYLAVESFLANLINLPELSLPYLLKGDGGISSGLRTGMLQK